MRDRVVKWIVIPGLIFFSLSVQARDFWEGPFFWQTKPALQERMRTERYIPVSVTSETDDGKKIWLMKGAGFVQAAGDFTLAWAQDYSQLQKLSDHFSSVEWDAAKSELHLVAKVMGRSYRLRFHLWTTLANSDLGGKKIQRLHWKVLDQPGRESQSELVGAEGALIITEITRQSCEVGLISRYNGNFAAFGNTFFAVAVEGVLAHVARSLRQSVEVAWQKQMDSDNKGPASVR